MVSVDFKHHVYLCQHRHWVVVSKAWLQKPWSTKKVIKQRKKLCSLETNKCQKAPYVGVSGCCADWILRTVRSLTRINVGRCVHFPAAALTPFWWRCIPWLRVRPVSGHVCILSTFSFSPSTSMTGWCRRSSMSVKGPSTPGSSCYNTSLKSWILL